MGEPDPNGDLSPWLADLDAYTREYTREDLAGLAADGRAYYDPAGRVWVVQGGPFGSFEISDAEVLETNAAGHLPDAYDTRFDGYTRETLNDLVGLGQAEYDQDRGVWTIYGENGPYEVRDVDSPAQVFMAGPAPARPRWKRSSTAPPSGTTPGSPRRTPWRASSSAPCTSPMPRARRPPPGALTSCANWTRQGCKRGTRPPTPSRAGSATPWARFGCSTRKAPVTSRGA